MATEKLYADFCPRAGVGVYKAMREKRRAVFAIERFLNTPPTCSRWVLCF